MRASVCKSAANSLVTTPSLLCSLRRASHTQVTYSLTEAGDATDCFDDTFRFETVDMSKLLASPSDPDEIAAVAAALGPALTSIGFAILTGHGVSEELLSEMHEAIEPFFTGLTADRKVAFAAKRKGSVNQGYFGLEETSRLHPDQVGVLALFHAVETLSTALATLSLSRAQIYPSPSLLLFELLCRLAHWSDARMHVTHMRVHTHMHLHAHRF